MSRVKYVAPFLGQRLWTLYRPIKGFQLSLPSVTMAQWAMILNWCGGWREFGKRTLNRCQTPSYHGHDIRSLVNQIKFPVKRIVQEILLHVCNVTTNGSIQEKQNFTPMRVCTYLKLQIYTTFHTYFFLLCKSSFVKLSISITSIFLIQLHHIKIFLNLDSVIEPAHHIPSTLG